MRRWATFLCSNYPTPRRLTFFPSPVEEVLGVQTLLLGLVAASVLRVGGAITKDKEKERATEEGSSAVAPVTLSYTATGARRTSVDITPRSNLLMQQLLLLVI